jgi:hypothetical protein
MHRVRVETVASQVHLGKIPHQRLVERIIQTCRVKLLDRRTELTRSVIIRKLVTDQLPSRDEGSPVLFFSALAAHSRQALAIFSKVSLCSGGPLRAIRSHSSAYFRYCSGGLHRTLSIWMLAAVTVPTSSLRSKFHPPGRLCDSIWDDGNSGSSLNVAIPSIKDANQRREVGGARMRAVEYRRYAAELILVARDIRNPDHKAALLDMGE